MHPRDLHIADFAYTLSDDRIAVFPLEERDTSKLLVFRDGVITDAVFKDVPALLPSGSLMIFNQTKVVRARLWFKKETGGIIEVFCLSPVGNDTDPSVAFAKRESVVWECLVGGAGKWKSGAVLEQRHVDPDFVLKAEMLGRGAGSYTIRLWWDNDALCFADVLHFTGKVPLPPYLRREAVADDDETYQTLYALKEGSVAAPTAGLHFTRHVFDGLRAAGVSSAFVTLHVGAGTFKPVSAETVGAHTMHEEWIEVDKETIDSLIANECKSIVAVGTTSVRTLESLYWIGAKLRKGIDVLSGRVSVGQWDAYEVEETCTAMDAIEEIRGYMERQGIEKITTRTQILIAPGYRFRLVEGMVTNFHQPQSTLLLLVSAFIGEEWKDVYHHALENGYRFLSYGDACLFWRKKER